MKEYDELVKRLQLIMKDNLICEDDKLYIKCGCKYSLFNLMEEIDNKFMKKLYKKLEYKD